MKNLYQKIKGWLANPNMLHIWMTYFIANVFACIFKFIGAVDPLMYIILAPVLAFFVGVFVESFDGFFGTKQEEKTGVKGNEFSSQDLLRDGIGCVVGMVAIAIMIL